jgi:hypothetical protein
MQGYKAIPAGDIDALKEAVYTKGPHAVSIDAAQVSSFCGTGVHLRTTTGPAERFREVVWPEVGCQSTLVLISDIRPGRLLS